MRVLIGRTFYFEKEDKLFVKGKTYSVNNEMAEWIVRKRLGEIIPVIEKIKEIKKPPKDKMMHKVKTK